MKKYLFLLIGLLALTSCSKEEGYGGLASISGKVYAKDYNSRYGKLPSFSSNEIVYFARSVFDKQFFYYL